VSSRCPCCFDFAGRIGFNGGVHEPENILEPLSYHVELRDYLKSHERELWNWFASAEARADYAENDPFMIRNFGGAMDEFCVFSRALSADEIRALYSSGKPQSDPVAELKSN
jgi:hypothetical protein